MMILSLDIGGTSIKSGLYEENLLKDTFSYPTNGKMGREKILDSVDKVYTYYINKTFQIDTITISSAGDIDPYRGIVVYASDNLVGFTGFKIKEYFENKYKVKCYVNNDAVCHLLGILDSNNINKNIFMITLGTGVGAVLYKNRSIYYGDKFDLGKFAHVTLVENGIKCDCGKFGCAEKELSKSYFKEASLKYFNKEIETKDIFDLFRNGEAKATLIVKDYFENFNKFIAYIDTLGVDLIYISGGIASSKDVFKMFVKDSRIQYVAENNLQGVRGALRLVK